ncbi:nucleotidyl transferase AbiEii/AbiGii toxin family protein [Chitinophaga silvatica]|uniref:Nucleotidyl transferase AbiEii/AbiGii toxin family protein n=1 Tax=Chitinophaga silvatica TaxID=2282649 RepID=A0A3E1YAT3_9BACT|nr:nucleotidyl transferase AbiEii/AbiGii toxin family protein [Chitinophaga silvatica]
MPNKLYWNTVTPLLKSTLIKLMTCAIFDEFRLVGGTALSLQIGHRMSVDIDLFTDAPYNSINFEVIDTYLHKTFQYVSSPTPGPVAIGKSYFIGTNEDNAIKLDLYYTDKFIQPPLIVETIRMATIEEIIAMKVDVVQRGGRKKDFWDLHDLIDSYSPNQLLDLHHQRYPYNHDVNIIKSNFVDFTTADDDFEPICLKDKYWEIIKLDIVEYIERLME